MLFFNKSYYIFIKGELMKLNVLFASLCFTCATGFVGAMEKQDPKFKLDNDLRIIEYKAKNREKVITSVVPLNPEDKTALENGFANGRDGKKKEKVKYTHIRF
jgi:hypothetical protein